MKRAKKILIALVAIILISISSLFMIGYVHYQNSINEIPVVDMIQEIRNDKHYTKLEDMDPMFIKAIIAVEDPDFYHHNGVKLSNIMEAFFTNLKEQSYVKGGSTITQQLAKNLYFDQEKTMTRKVAELFFVKQFESSLEKDEILELYLNVIYFGDGYYGIYDASMGYFNVLPSKLSDAQATLLAGLPQAPAAYQLSDHYDLAKQRQKIVLEALYDQNLIDIASIDWIYKQVIYK